MISQVLVVKNIRCAKHDISFSDDGSILVPKNDEVVRHEVKSLLKHYHLDSEVLNERRLVIIKMHRERFQKKYKV